MAKGFILGQDPNLSNVENKIQQVDSKFSNYLPLSGGTMKGNLVLNGNPISDNQAATKQYVDSNLSKLSWTKIDTINTEDEIHKYYNVTKYFIVSIITNRAKLVTRKFSIKVGLSNSTTPPEDYISLKIYGGSESKPIGSACVILRNNIGTSIVFVGTEVNEGQDIVIPFGSTKSNYLHIDTIERLSDGTIDVYGFG